MCLCFRCLPLFLVILGSAAPSQETDWGFDVLVADLGAVPSLRKLIADGDTNGDIYVSVIDSGPAGADTAYTWLSSDGGLTWNLDNIFAADSTTGAFQDCELRVGQDAGGTWLYHFVVCAGPGPRAGLWVRRARPSSPAAAWVRVAGGDSVLHVSADRNCESPEWLFAAWETRGGRICAMSSSDSGQTWGNLRQVTTESRLPALCAGGDGCVYVASSGRDSAWASVARFEDNLVNPVPADCRVDSGATGRIASVSLAADRDAACSLQTAVMLYCRRDSVGRVVPQQAWTTDGGQSWRLSIWPVTNQNRTTWDARFPVLRRSYDDPLIRAVVTMHEPSRNWDTLVYAYARPGAPTVWDGRYVVNQYRASDVVGSALGYSSSQSGAFLTYARYGTDCVYFDGYARVNVDDRPVAGAASPALSVWAATQAELLVTLKQRCRIVVDAVDAAGRVEGRLYRGTAGPGQCRLSLSVASLPTGVHFLRISSDAGTLVAKAIVHR